MLTNTCISSNAGRVLDADTIEYAVTIDDPTTWTRPWTVKQELKKQSDAANRIYYEPRCHEGNYGLPGIAAAARASRSKRSRKDAALIPRRDARPDRRSAEDSPMDLPTRERTRTRCDDAERVCPERAERMNEAAITSIPNEQPSTYR